MVIGAIRGFLFSISRSVLLDYSLKEFNDLENRILFTKVYFYSHQPID